MNARTQDPRIPPVRRNPLLRPLLALLLGSAPLLLAACEEGGVSGPAVPEGPSRLISDATQVGGTEGFYFLPPLVGSPDLSGQSPLPAMAPRVEVCVVDMTTSPWACGTEPLHAVFGAADIMFDGTQYQVDWDTQNPAISPTIYGDTTTYRLSVFIGTLELGYVDLQFGATGGTAKNLTTSEVVGLKDGRTVPAKFFLGDAIPDFNCGDGFDCRTGEAYPEQDNLFITRDRDAALFIPADALPPNPNGEPYQVTIRELANCPLQFPADLYATGKSQYLPVYNSCYEYLIEPDVAMLKDITIGQCIELPETNPRREELQLGADHGANAVLPVGVGRYELMPNTPSPAPLTCEDYVPGANPTGAVAFVRDVKRAVTSFFLGKPAYAGHLGLGGTARDKSIVAWVDPGLRVAGFSAARGGFVAIRSAALQPAITDLVNTYGYVWRDTASVISSALLMPDVDVAILGTVATNISAIAPLSQAEQDALATFVDGGGCTVLLADNNTFSQMAEAANESLVDAFGLDVTGSKDGAQTATVNAQAPHAATAGIGSWTQNYPGWFDGAGAGTVLGSNPGGPAFVTIPGDGGSYGVSGPVFAFSDANQFFAQGSAGYYQNASNSRLFRQTVGACGTEPAPAP